MADTTKQEELKQKLLDFFDKKLTDLTTKFQTDIDSLEKMKYEYFDTVVIKYREIEEEHKKQESEEKEKQDKEKEKPEKKDETKHEKVQKKKIDSTNRPKTPLATKRPKAKEEKPHDKTEIHKEKKEVKPKASGTKASGTMKAPANKKGDAGKRPVTAKADPKAKTIKKGTANAKKVDPKKGGKKGAKKDKKEEEKKEEEASHETEEKKPVVINPKYKYNISDELKNNPGLSCIYFVLKGKYITDKKQFLHLATFSPLLYKSFGNSLKFLLDDKKKEAQDKANEIEKFLNNYGDLNTYLSKEFSLSKKAINSIQFFKQKEEDEILKMPEIPKEVGLVLKLIYYIIDESFDENKSNKELFENLLHNVLTRNEDKSFKSLLVNYCNQNKFLNLTKEKFDKINNIINENNTILNMIAMTKMCRPISLFCFLLKEVYDYINLKTLDEQYYFDLRLKNNELQKYKDILYLIENDGKPREPPKEEKKEEQKVEQAAQPDSQPKTEEAPKNEETPKTEEATKTSEEQILQEQAQNPTEQQKNEDTAKEETPTTEGGEKPKPQE